MARQDIDTGEFPKSITAEQIWEAFVKTNENFTELYKLLGLVNVSKYVRKTGDTMTGTLTANAVKFDDPLGYETNEQGDIFPYATAAGDFFTIHDAAKRPVLRVFYDGVRGVRIADDEVLHTGNGGGEVEDVPIYSTTKILATKPFRELFTTLDKNAQITLTLPVDAVPQFAPTVMFHTLHKGAGWKLTFTQAVRWYGGVAPTQVTADNTFATWMFHYAKGVWLGSYNIAKA